MQITIDTRETLSVEQALHLASLLAGQNLTNLKVVKEAGPAVDVGPKPATPAPTVVLDELHAPAVVIDDLYAPTPTLAPTPEPTQYDPKGASDAEVVVIDARPAPKKRKRRTKAQLAAAKRQAEEDAAILAAAKEEPAEPASPPVAAAAELAPPPAAPLEESTPSPPSPGVLSTGDMKSVVGQALTRLTDAGDENAAKTVVAFLTSTTGKKRISEIEADLYPEVAAGLRELKHIFDPLA